MRLRSLARSTLALGTIAVAACGSPRTSSTQRAPLPPFSSGSPLANAPNPTTIPSPPARVAGARLYAMRRTAFRADTPDGRLAAYLLAGAEVVVRAGPAGDTSVPVELHLSSGGEDQRLAGYVASADLTDAAVPREPAPSPWDVESDPHRARFLSGPLTATPGGAEIGRVECAGGRVLEQKTVSGATYSLVAIPDPPHPAAAIRGSSADPRDFPALERVGWMLGDLSPLWPGTSDCKRILRMPDPQAGKPQPHLTVPREWVAVGPRDAGPAASRLTRMLTPGKSVYWLTTGSSTCERWPVQAAQEKGTFRMSGIVLGEDGKAKPGSISATLRVDEHGGAVSTFGLSPGAFDELMVVNEREGGVALVWPPNPSEGDGLVRAYHPDSVNMWFDDPKVCAREAARRARTH